MKFLYTFIILFFSVVSANAKDWKALWITTDRCQSATNSWICFRKSVELPAMDGTPVYADIAVDSKYWMWINGEMVVFEGGLKRGPNPRDTYYDRVDIAPYLTEGKNSIAILLWYFGKDGFSHNSSGRAGLLFDCQTEKFEILSDASWKCKPYEAYGQTGEPHPNWRLPESNTRYGFIKADLQRKGKKIRISFEVPEGTTAWVMKNGKRHPFEAGKHRVTLNE